MSKLQFWVKIIGIKPKLKIERPAARMYQAVLFSVFDLLLGLMLWNDSLNIEALGTFKET